MSITSSKYSLLFLLLSFAFITSCDDDDMAPPEGDGEEIITDVVLTFSDGTNTVTATAQDPDGDGPQDLAVVTNPTLAPNTTYTLTITLNNSIDMEDITAEIQTEADEHQFFFSWTDGLFSGPAGNGNIDQPEDNAVNYNDNDGGGLPLGLSTAWTTGDASTTNSGDFRVLLKHQPPVNGTAVKTATSTATDGDTDIDITWTLSLQ